MLRGASCVAAVVALDYPRRRRCRQSCTTLLQVPALPPERLSALPVSHVVSFRDHLIPGKVREDIMKEYIAKKKVGKGAYGQVLLATQKRTGIDRAIKQISKAQTLQQEFEDEVDALMALDHPHIVKIIEYFEDGADYWVVEEFCNGPSVSQFLTSTLRINENEGCSDAATSIILRQCLKAVAGCHGHGFIHRDLKPENFVFIENQDSTVKLIDFGLATRCLPTAKLQELAGTLTYMAPEMVLEKPYTSAVDVWSLGALFYLMLSGDPLLPRFESTASKKRLLSDPDYVPRLLRQAKWLHRRESSADACDLLEKMLTYDPARRINVTDALAHPFIMNYCYDLIDSSTSRTFRRDRIENWVFDPELVNKMRRFAEAPRLQKVAMLAVAQIASVTESPTRATELLSAQRTFRIMDSSGDGEICLEELKHELTSRGFNIPPDIDVIFAACDASSNGKLNFSEFIASSLCGSQGFLCETLCREAFRLLDKRKDGRIGPVDLDLLFKYAKSKPSTYELKDFEAMIDEAGGGKKGYIDFEDFCRLLGLDARV